MRKKLAEVILLVVIAIGLIYISDYKMNDIKLIIDGNSRCISTFSSNVDDILKKQEIQLSETDFINVDKSEPVRGSSTIIVKTNKNIELKINNEILNLKTYANTVEGFLKEKKIQYDENDIVSPKLVTKLEPRMSITLDKVDEKVVTEYESIPFKTSITSNNSFSKGTNYVSQKGIDGLIEVKKYQKFINGLLKEDIVLGKLKIKDPVTQILQKGTGTKLVASRGSSRYKKIMTMKASAYDLSYESTGKRPGDKGYGITASGMKARKGVVAVDPKVIPLGTKLYIESLDGTPDYGYAVAGDTGGAIKGNRIDLFYNDVNFVNKYGIKKVKVYVLY